MKRGKRIALTLMWFASVVLLSLPMDVAAASPNFSVTINDASYSDLDNDTFEDDVLIFFTCVATQAYKGPSRTEFYFTLTLPSGHQHFALVVVLGKFSELRLALHWFDSAWEQGWYNVKVDVVGAGAKGGYACDSFDFDPPTNSGGGDPTIKVSFW